MVEEIITALSRIRWLFVIARNSSFTYKGQAVDVKQVGRELGRPLCARRLGAQGGRPGAHHRAADRRGNRQRISGPTASTARSKTCSTFRTRWPTSVAGVIEPALQAAEVRAVGRHGRRSDLTAYGLYLRALPRWVPTAASTPSEH